MGALGPRVLVDLRGSSVGRGGAGAVLGEQCQGTTAAGSPRQPDNQGYLVLGLELELGLACRQLAGCPLLKEPVEQVLVGFCVELAALDCGTGGRVKSEMKPGQAQGGECQLGLLPKPQWSWDAMPVATLMVGLLDPSGFGFTQFHPCAN